MADAKFIFVTGGVVSSLGKGITAASIGYLLKSRGLKIDILKFDPYLNVDPGTMNPYQHGEIFVTGDGAETDLDLGHYERFLDQVMKKVNNVTAGQIYEAIIQKERRGDYLGKTIQVVPHVTEEIKSRIKLLSKGKDVVIVEIGGTVGDIESLPFLEAIRQFRLEENPDDVCYVHLTLLPYIKVSQEQKTKPTQHSVRALREIGIEPQILICRAERRVSIVNKEKIALFCNLPRESVIEELDVGECIWKVPLDLARQKLDEIILDIFKIKVKEKNLKDFEKIVESFHSPKGEVRIAIAGKYTELKDAYKSIREALFHAGLKLGLKVNVEYVDVERDFSKKLAQAQGILVPGGFGDRGVEGKIAITGWARKNKKPFFGICLGMQCAVIDFARAIGLKNANSIEFAPATPHPVITLLPEQKKINQLGGTMRLGTYPCRIKYGTRTYQAYKKKLVKERHRHRYELNPSYRAKLERHGLIVSGLYKNLAEIIEIRDHPWFVACQFHPEFVSRPLRPHPLFLEFIKHARGR